MLRRQLSSAASRLSRDQLEALSKQQLVDLVLKRDTDLEPRHPTAARDPPPRTNPTATATSATATSGTTTSNATDPRSSARRGDRSGGDTSSTRKRKLARRDRLFDMSRYAQRHVALRIAYIGERYAGLAWSSDEVETVESKLLEGLLKTKLIESREGCAFSRGGRTDKGVSALGQVCASEIPTVGNWTPPILSSWGVRPPPLTLIMQLLDCTRYISPPYHHQPKTQKRAHPLPPPPPPHTHTHPTNLPTTPTVTHSLPHPPPPSPPLTHTLV